MGIFSFFKSEPNVDLILSEKENIRKRLDSIKKILSENNYPAQARVLENLLMLLSQENISEFTREIQSVNMWGGAGAVWEVWFESNKTQTSFATEMRGLIIILEKLKIATSSIKSLKSYF